MPKPLSSSLKANLNTITSDEHPLILLEITHEDLSIPLRVVNDKKEVISQGEAFIPCPFELVLPDENEGQLPRASIKITNVGRALTYWIERSMGAMGAEIKIIIIQRSNPNLHEWSITMGMSNVVMDIENVTASLDFRDILNLPAVPIIYNVAKSPGLY